MHCHPRPAVGPRRGVLVVFAWLVVAGCASAAPVGDPVAGVYDHLEACEPLPAGLEAPEGIRLPAELVITDLSEVDPLVQVTGLIDATPLEVRALYAEDPALVHIEDEGFEAEVLLATEGYRTFVRAQARCRTGSVITVVHAPEDQAERLPVPGQAVGTPDGGM